MACAVLLTVAISCLSGILPGAYAQTILGAGDIAFTGYNSDNPDDFSFVLLKDVQAGTTITFTDRGWLAAGGFRAGESTLTVTFAANRTTGEQFRVPAVTGIFIDFSGLNAGTSIGTNILLSAAGDQLFAYQGAEPADNTPAEQAKFITAIQMNGPWDADAVNDNTTAIPPGLSNGVNALAISPQVDNARYDCSITGPTVAALRAAIHNPANWLKDDNIRFALPAPCNLVCGLGTDNQPPVIFCPFEMEEIVDAACDFTLPDYRPMVFAFDNCDPNFTLAQLPAPGTIVSGNTLISITAEDAYGNKNTCSFQLFVTDNIKPVITNCPGTQTGNAGESCLFTVPDYRGMISVSDNCDPAPGLFQQPAPGSLVSQNTVITLTAVDASGNMQQCSFMLEIKDVTPPQVSCSIDRFAYFDQNCSFTLLDYSSFILTGDECDPIPQVIQLPAPGTVVYGDTGISFKIKDASGNETSCFFNLILLDNTPPSVQVPPQFTVPLDANCAAVFPDLRPLVVLTDNCDPNPTLIQVPGPGEPLTGNSFVVFLAADASNNINFGFAPVLLKDETPPAVSCISTTIALDNTGTYTLLPADVIDMGSLSDNCGPVTIESIQPPVVNCSHAGSVVPVVVTVKDAAGNTANCTANVTVTDVVNVPAGWTSSMIGNISGGATLGTCGNNFTVYSSGFSLTPTLDAVQFVHKELCGNGEIIAYVADVTNLGWAGIMMRENLAPGSKKAVLRTQLSSNIIREVRTSTNGMTNSQQFLTPNTPRWLRLVRSGNSFTGYSSVNGVNWDLRFASTISMASCIKIGIFSQSINNTTVTAASFNNITLIGAITPLWADNHTERNIEKQTLLEAYPNPASDEITVTLTGLTIATETNLFLINSVGQTVHRSKYDPAEGITQRIPVRHLPPGLYVLQAHNENGLLQTVKIVVQRQP
jgi:hypothetical protein